jgi:hypothetical protein
MKAVIKETPDKMYEIWRGRLMYGVTSTLEEAYRVRQAAEEKE